MSFFIKIQIWFYFYNCKRKQIFLMKMLIFVENYKSGLVFEKYGLDLYETIYLVFILENIDWIYVKSIDLVFVLKNIDWIYMKRYRSGFCFGKYRMDLYKKHRSSFWEGKYK